VPDTLSFAQIEEGINRIYGTRNFSKIYYRLTGEESKTLTLYADEKSISALNAGFNYNTNDKAAILLNGTWSNRQSDGARASLDLMLSASPKVKASIQFKQKNLPEIGLDLSYKYFEINVWDRDEKIIISDTDYIYSDLYLFGVFKNNLMTGLGGRAEYFKLAPLFSAPPEGASVRNTTSFYSLYVFFRYDSFDDRYVPRHGLFVNAEFNAGYDQAVMTSFADVLYSAFVKAQWARSITPGICLLPAIYSRMLVSGRSPAIKTNMMGGTHHNPYFRETMPFIGVERIISLREYAAIGRLDLRVQIAKRHYISLLANLAFHSHAIDATADFKHIFGGGLLYTYDSLVGPVEFYLSASDYHSGVRGFVNLGYWF
jgi:NTE family protein